MIVVLALTNLPEKNASGVSTCCDKSKEVVWWAMLLNKDNCEKQLRLSENKKTGMFVSLLHLSQSDKDEENLCTVVQSTLYKL